jgi:hypothetical protein
VLFTTFFKTARAAFRSTEVYPCFRRSERPTYGFLDQYLGRGIVRGNPFSLSAQGRAAKLVTKSWGYRRSAPLRYPAASCCSIGQMQRWGISGQVFQREAKFGSAI